MPNNYPFIVTQQLIIGAVSKWGSPADTLFHATSQALRKRLSNLIDEHFGQFALLKQRIAYAVYAIFSLLLLYLQSDDRSLIFEHLRERAADTQASLARLQVMEKSPFTRNDHYFADYREKFLTHYKAVRRQDSNSFIAQLDNGQSSGDEAFRQTLSTAMASIQSLGFHDFKPADIPRLLPPDPCEAAIEIMADVRAYFQGVCIQVTTCGWLIIFAQLRTNATSTMFL